MQGHHIYIHHIVVEARSASFGDFLKSVQVLLDFDRLFDIFYIPIYSLFLFLLYSIFQTSTFIYSCLV